MVQGGGFDLGNAHGYVDIDYSGVTAGLANAQRSFDSALQAIGSSVTRVGDSMTGLGVSITALTAPLTLFTAQGISAAADFEVLMKQIEIFGGVAPEQMTRVADFAKQMGADTKFAASDAAAAMLDMLKAGYSLEQSMAALPSVLNLAAVGEMSLGQAAGITTSALAQFGMEAEEANRVANALARAANASRADVADLGQALNSGGALAKQYGLSIEETTAALGVFSNAGLEGERAGTALRSMLTQMTSDAKPAQEAWRELGVSFYDASGNVRNFDTVIKELDAALDKLPVEEQNRLMQDLAGTYGILGLQALRTSNGIGDMVLQMRNAPEAAEIAAAFMDTYKGAIESLAGSIETLQLEVITPFMENSLKPLIKRMIEVVNGITDWARSHPQLAQQIVRLSSVLVGLGPALIIAGQAVRFVGVGISALAPVIAALTGPVGLVAAAAAGLYIAFQNNFLGIRDFLQPILDRLMTVFILLSKAVGDVYSRLSEGISLYVALKTGLGSYVGAIARALGASDEFAEGLRRGFNQTLRNVKNFINDAVEGIENFAERFRIAFRIFQVLLSVGNDFALTRAFSMIFPPEVAGEIVSGIRLVQNAFERFRASAVDVFQRVRANLTAAFLDVRRLFEQFSWASSEGANIFQAVEVALRNIVSPELATDIAERLRSIADVFTRAFTSVRNLLGQVGTFIGNILRNVDLTALFNVGQTLLSLSNPISAFITVLRALGANINIGEAILRLVDGVTAFFAVLNDGGSVFGALRAGFGSFLDDIARALGFTDEVSINFSLIFSEIIWTIEDGFGRVVNFIQNTALPGLQALGDWFLVDVLPGVITYVTTVVIPMLQTLADWFINSLLPAVNTVLQEQVIPLLQDFFGFLGRVWEIVGPGLMEFAQWFVADALPVILNFISGTVVPAIGDFIELIRGIWETVSPGLLEFLDWFVNTGLPAVRDFIVNEVIPNVQYFIDVLNGIWIVVQPYLQQLYDWFTNTGLPKIRDFIEEVRTQVIDKFITTLSDLWNKVSGPLGELKGGLEKIFNHIKNNVLQPVIDTINKIIDRVQAALDALALIGGGGSVTDRAQGAADLVNTLLRDNGGDGRAGLPYLIGPSQQGKEVFVPGADGSFIPNFIEQVAAAVQGGRGGGGNNLHFAPGAIQINSDTYEGGKAAGRGFADALQELIRGDG